MERTSTDVQVTPHIVRYTKVHPENRCIAGHDTMSSPIFEEIRDLEWIVGTAKALPAANATDHWPMTSCLHEKQCHGMHGKRVKHLHLECYQRLETSRGSRQVTALVHGSCPLSAACLVG